MRRFIRIISRFIGGTACAIFLGRGIELMFHTENPLFWFTLLATTALIWLLVEKYIFKTSWPRSTPKETPPENNITLSSIDEEKSVSQNPVNHRQVVRLIMQASTIGEIEELLDDYRHSPHCRKEFEHKVFAAHVLKGMKLKSDLQSRNEWWYQKMSKEVGRMGYDHNEVIREIDYLDEEYFKK